CGRAVDEQTADRLVEAGEALEQVLATAEPGRVEQLPPDLSGALRTSRDAAAACVTALGPERKEDVDGSTARKLALAVTEEVHDAAVRVLEAFDEDAAGRDVVWVAAEPNRPPAVRVAPLSVGGLLRERLFGPRTTVLTSATLALGGSFDALARQ